MTARDFQTALPPSAVAYRVAEAAGFKRKTWAMMVYREQELTGAQRAALASACDRLAADLRAFGKGVR